MTNVNELISKIEEFNKQQMNAEDIKYNNRVNTIKSYVTKIKAYREKLNELSIVVDALSKNGFDLVSEMDYSGAFSRVKYGSKTIEVFSDGINHRFGIIKNRTGMLGYGCEGGGCCGDTLYFDNSGNRVMYGSYDIEISYLHEMNRGAFEKSYNLLEGNCRGWLAAVDKYINRVYARIEEIVG